MSFYGHKKNLLNLLNPNDGAYMLISVDFIIFLVPLHVSVVSRGEKTLAVSYGHDKVPATQEQVSLCFMILNRHV